MRVNCDRGMWGKCYPLHHGVYNAEPMAKILKGLRWYFENIVGDLKLILFAMARLLEGKAAAITGGVTGKALPTTQLMCKTYKRS